MFFYSLNDIPVNSSVYIYGTGDRGVSLKKFIEENNYNVQIKSFLDTFKEGQFEHGSICKIDNFTQPLDENELILVCSCEWQEIVKELEKYNIKNYLVCSFEFGAFLNTYYSNDKLYIILSFEDKVKYEPKAQKIIEHFEDESDKNLYKLLYDIRSGNKPEEDLKQKIIKNINSFKYQYLDFVNKDAIKTMIDAGVYDGSGMSFVLKHLTSLDNMFAFEPLRETYCPNIFDYIDKTSYKNFEIYPHALWEKNETLSFRAEHHASCVGQGDNTITVKAVKLDGFKLAEDVKVDFVKMDIEDAELNALKGMRETILRDRPQMAICIYHSNEQFFEVPNYLIDLLSDYTFKIGQYSTKPAETVFYAIPNEVMV